MQEYVCSRPQFTACEIQFKTGGLGVLKVQDEFLAWVCVKDHQCADSLSSSWFCFVYNEQSEVFVPW